MILQIVQSQNKFKIPRVDEPQKIFAGIFAEIFSVIKELAVATQCQKNFFRVGADLDCRKIIFLAVVEFFIERDPFR